MDKIKLLQALIERYADKNQAKFGREVGISPSMISQYITGHRMLGPAQMRKIEGKLKLPPQWFDLQNPIAALDGLRVEEPVATSAVEADQSIAEVVRLMRGTDDAGRLKALGAVQYALSQHEPASANRAA